MTICTVVTPKVYVPIMRLICTYNVWSGKRLFFFNYINYSFALTVDQLDSPHPDTRQPRCPAKPPTLVGRLKVLREPQPWETIRQLNKVL